MTLQLQLQRPARIDALPEYTDYADSGCDLYPSCLRCPLPKCRYEDPGGAPGMLRVGRNASITRLAFDQGVGVEEIARMFGLSRRTVFRVLAEARDKPSRPGHRL